MEMTAIPPCRRMTRLFTLSSKRFSGRALFCHTNSWLGYWIDNVKLHEVAVLLRDSTENSKFYCNTDSMSKNVNPGDGDYLDMDGNPVSGSFTLEPYSSAVLISRLSMPGVNVKAMVEGRTSDLSLFPNPFNPDCRIFFNVTKSDQIRLSIYTVKGRLIKTLAQCVFTPGMHTIRWDGSDNAGKPAAAGIYAVRLKSGKETRYFNAVLLK
jgi:hypothetical protein